MKRNCLDFGTARFNTAIMDSVYRAYKADLGSGDVTANSVLKPMEIRAVIKSEASGILAGMLEARLLLIKLGIRSKECFKEGARIKKGDTILELQGDARKILSAERTLLNFLTRLSGIATLTNEMAGKTSARLAATRKTCFQFSDKRAVKIGGGITHRLGLFDMVLIKENHIDIVSKELHCSREKAITECIKRAKLKCKGRKIEIEVKTIREALSAAREKPDIIMLDGAGLSNVKKAVLMLKGSGICIEASGGITPENIAQFGKAGVDVVSSGHITNSNKPLDMSLEVVL
jgi:nicotinate-nucleotide pyrophosphorylase (carboxylating)